MTLLSIIHSNDTHSYLENFDKRLHLVNSIRSKNADTLLLDSGDVLTGSLFFPIFQGEKEAYLLNRLGYDAMTLGNHEFDNGSKFLFDFIKRLKFPIVSSNLDLSKDPFLKHAKHVKDYLIKELSDGTRVGIFGLTTPTTPSSSSPSKETYFGNPYQHAKEMVALLKEEGVSAIILLSHLGDDEDRLLAKEIAGIDLILGAHTHKLFREPQIIKHQSGEWQTLMTQMGSYGQYIGEASLSFADGKLVDISHQVHDLALYDGYDRELKLEINDWIDSLESVTNRPLTVLSQQLIQDRELAKTQSTNLTNLVTDAYFEKASQLGFSVDIAIMNSGGIRQSIPQGPVTYGQVMQVLPFSCQLVVSSLSGQELFDCLANGAYPQVSQARLFYRTDVLKNMILDKVELLGVNGYQPLDLTASYLVATNTFIASGKDRYTGFDNKENLIRESVFDTDLLIEYMASLPKPIAYNDEARILIVED